MVVHNVNSIQRNLDSKVFDIINIAITSFFGLLCLLPFLNVFALSMSSGRAIMSGDVSFFPVEIQFNAYAAVFKNSAMMASFKFTALLTLVYTAVSILMTICAAYPLTKKGLKGKRYILILIIFTMYFNAGIIPNYIVVKNLGLIDRMWSLIFPGMISAYNLILLRTFFLSIPESLIEAAYLDGCSEVRTLITIVLPLSKPVLATLCLFYAVGRWNGFQDALYYINTPDLYPLQLKLREIIVQDRMAEIGAQEGGLMSNLVAESVKSASIMFATVPILALYPWLQKYFISGVMIGAVKE